MFKDPVLEQVMTLHLTQRVQVDIHLLVVLVILLGNHATVQNFKAIRALLTTRKVVKA